MERKTINQNKLQTLLCIIALTLGVLVSAVLFSMPPVHAETLPDKCASNPGHYYSNITWESYNPKATAVTIKNYDRYTDLILEGNYFFAYVYGTTVSNNTDIPCISLYYGDLSTGKVDLYKNSKKYTDYIPEWYSGSSRFYDVYRQNNNGSYNTGSTGLGFQLSFQDTEYNVYQNIAYDTDLPVFSSTDAMTAYILTGDKSGLITPEPPNTTDESYTFTGFSINGKTARWTGTTDRSFAKEVDVEEYVKISYAWATTTEPDNPGELQSYDGEFPTSEKRLTLPWSEMENGKTDFQFIRQVKIYPCYRVPHLAYYNGQPVTIYYNTDGSIDKISNPNTPGVLDDSIPIPVLSVNNDKGTFLFANAQNNYKFELKGRFWSTDDFYVFRKMPSLVWQYKYLTLLKNSLTTWVSVGDNMSTLSTYSFGDLGKESWNDLLNTYPIENRNIITGEQQGWLSWANITGYNDAITTLKTLLSTPYSLFNGYEVYVRYYVVCDDGSIKYSKWTHYFNNLADADGSTGSIVDDASNMNNGSQSDKGLTDSDMDNVENSGNSRNDVDAKPSNDFSVEISDITGLFNQFINILKSLYSGMGQLPSLVNAIFGFLPSWASTMIGISLVVIIIFRIIGR